MEGPVAFQTAHNKETVLLLVPSHCSYRIQALDMTFFKALNKTTYKVSAGATKLGNITR
jgi:hypothetical protein